MNYWGKCLIQYTQVTSIYTIIIIFCIYIVYEGWAHSSQVNSPFRTSFANLSPSRKGSCFIKRFGWRDKSCLPSFTTLSLAAFALSSEFSNLKNDDLEVRDFPFNKKCFFFGGGRVWYIDKILNLK